MKKLLVLLSILLLLYGCSSNSSSSNVSKQEDLNVLMFDESGFSIYLKYFDIDEENELKMVFEYTNDYDSTLYVKPVDVTINDYMFVEHCHFSRIDYGNGTGAGGEIWFEPQTSGLVYTNAIDLNEYQIDELGSISFALEMSKNIDYTNSVRTDVYRKEFIENYNGISSLDNMTKYEYEFGNIYIDQVYYDQADAFSKPSINISGALIKNEPDNIGVYPLLFVNDEVINETNKTNEQRVKQGNFLFTWPTEYSEEELKDASFKIEFEYLGRHYDVMFDGLSN